MLAFSFQVLGRSAECGVFCTLSPFRGEGDLYGAVFVDEKIHNFVLQKTHTNSRENRGICMSFSICERRKMMNKKKGGSNPCLPPEGKVLWETDFVKAVIVFVVSGKVLW